MGTKDADSSPSSRPARQLRSLLESGEPQSARELRHSMGPEELVAFQHLLATRASVALSGGEFDIARTCLAELLEVTPLREEATRLRLQFDLARAVAGSGDLAGAHDLFSDVAIRADAAGEHDLVVDAAVRCTLPPDWRAGDRRATALLDLAQTAVAASPERRPAVLAARAMVEMRVPAADPDHQIAWVTRASVAQPLADQALSATEGHATADRLVALVAWRATHRSPSMLAQRVEISRQAVDLAQRLRDHERLVDAAVAMAVDSIESGDRGGLDTAHGLVRWVANTERNPRVQWWAATLSASRAFLDDDPETADAWRQVAFDLGQQHDLPGWVAAELVLRAQSAVVRDDPDELIGYVVPPDSPVLDSPIASACIAWIGARLGERDRAKADAYRVLRTLDEESSLLLCLTFLARAAALLDEPELSGEVDGLLSGWHGHHAVDASAWWCAGPVELARAELASAWGPSMHDAGRLAGAARRASRRLGDGPSTRRAEALLERMPRARKDAVGDGPFGRALKTLTPRELQVLELLSDGYTNAEIGAQLSYSASTIRADTVSIYRKLDVKGRAQAAALATANGLISGSSSE